MEPVKLEPVKTHLWMPTNAMFFLIMLTIILVLIYTAISAVSSVRNVKKNWAEKRCSPSIMPFASMFGYDSKDNFEFCMGKIFSKHSDPQMSSTTGMMSSFTGVLGTIFGSINSLKITISDLAGGITQIFQEFKERLGLFFLRLQISAITIKALIGRMHAVLFSIMYMGMSGITGLQSFTNTSLFGFLDTFCFPGNTEIMTTRGLVQIKDIKIGDILTSHVAQVTSQVTATFRFYAKGQAMVKIGNTIVSTNHYMVYKGRNIKAVNHPDAIKIDDWDNELYCLNTHNNKIPIDDLLFLDYDETAEGDKDTMNYIEGRVNASTVNKEYNFKEYCPAIDENTYVKTTDGNKLAKDIKMGDIMVTGSDIVGLVRRVVHETCNVNGTILTPSTLYWDKNCWKRIGDTYPTIKGTKEMVSFIAVPNSQIELEELVIRDYMELCSPDSEIHYSKRLDN